MVRLIVAALVLLSSASISNAEEKWISLFNGKDLSGWKANVAPDSYSVKDGLLKVHNTSAKVRSHLFYVGDDALGQASPPSGTFIDFDAGSDHSCGIRTDGNVTCWGGDGSGQATPPDLLSGPGDGSGGGSDGGSDGGGRFRRRFGRGPDRFPGRAAALKDAG